MEIWEIALSALVGGLAATLISVWYQHVSEQIKNRRLVIIAVTEWLDNIYTRLQVLSGYKESLFKQNQKSMSRQKYRTMNNEMRISLLSNKIIMEVACTYGKENILLQNISTLRDNMTEAARVFWNPRQETWAESYTQIMNMFNNNIDPLRQLTINSLFNSLSEFSILKKIKIKK